jgi:hypothetical protein
MGNELIRMGNAVKRILSLVGLAPTTDSIRSAMNPFLEDLPDPVVVTPTPPEGEGDPSTYQMAVAEPHVEIATGNTLLLVTLPVLTGCDNGQKFSLKLTQGEGGLTYAVLSGYGVEMLVVPGIRYQFVVANGNNLTMLNDWVLWGRSIIRIADLIGEAGDVESDGSLWGQIGTKAMESDPDGPLWAVVKDLQERIATLEGGT